MRKLLFSLLMVCLALGGLLHQAEHVHAATLRCYFCDTSIYYDPAATPCGEHAFVCPNPECGETVFANVGTVHSYEVMDRIEATCTTDGSVDEICSRCGDDRLRVLKATGHHFEVFTSPDSKDATCTSDGVRYERCTNSGCGETRTSTISATGHSYEEISNTTTCTTSGIKTQKCSKCGDTKTETISAYGHKYAEKTVKKATCTETGLIRKTCSRCDNIQEIKTKALDHKWSDWKVKTVASCEEKGLETRVCSRCKDEEERELEALGHKSSEMTLKKEATCTEDGYKSSECETCGKEFKEVIPATGHDFLELEVSVEPGLGKEGLKEATCKHCEEIKTEVIPALTVGEFVSMHTGAVAGGVAGVTGVAGAGIYLVLSKKKAAEAAATAVAAGGLGAGGKIAAANAAKKLLEGLETKIIDVVAADTEGSRSLIDAFKKQPMLEVNYDGLENIAEKVEENGPDMIVFEVNDDEDLVKITDWIIELDDDEIRYAAIGPKEVVARNAQTLKMMKEEGKLVSFTSYEKTGGIIADIILPLYKPELNVENSLNGAGIVMSALGLDWAAGIIDMLVAGNDIREIVADGDPEAEDKLTILADVCSIFGLEAGDTFESIASYIEGFKHTEKKAQENLGAEDPDKKEDDEDEGSKEDIIKSDSENE